MLKNYLLIALRNIRRHRLFSFINLLGLALGISCCLLIYLYVRYEFSYDDFQEKKDHVVRLHCIDYTQSVAHKKQWAFLRLSGKEAPQRSGYLPVPMAPALEEELPEVKRALRISEGEVSVAFEDQAFVEDVQFVDSSFFELFSFPLLAGDPTRALRQPDDVVISQEVANRIFGETSPMGKTLEISLFEGSQPFQVVGVVADPPPNSSLDIDLLLPIQQKPFFKEHATNWFSYTTQIFAELQPNFDAQQFQQRLDSFNVRHFGKQMEQIRTSAQLAEDDQVYGLGYTLLRDMHLTPEVPWPGVSDPMYAYVLTFVAALILLIACINYITLALARSLHRVREVGVRKVMGASRRQILVQFWGEAQLLTLGAVALGLMLVDLFLPIFNTYTQQQITLQAWDYLELGGVLLLLAGCVGMLAGGYPAYFLSKYNPIDVLRIRHQSTAKSWFSQILVGGQFALTTFFVIVSVVMYQQMAYLSEKDLGFDPDQVVVLPTFTGYNDEGEQLVNRYRAALTHLPEVTAVSAIGFPFTRGYSRISFRMDQHSEDFYTFINRIDEAYQPVMGFELEAGKNLQAGSNGSKGVLVNEQFVVAANLEEPVGALIPWPSHEEPSVIRGVVKDFHLQSLKHEIGPLIMHNNSTYAKVQYAAVKLRTPFLPETLAKLENSWKEVAGNVPFDPGFLDEEVAQQYSFYRRWTYIMSFATGLAMLIACMGLFGLSGLTVVNRTKEISIRKILGAGIGDILLLLNKGTLQLILLAFVLAAPLAWWVMQQWMKDFTYHVELGWGVLAVTLLMCLGVSLLTVSAQSWRAARSNPAETLRNE